MNHRAIEDLSSAVKNQIAGVVLFGDTQKRADNDQVRESRAGSVQSQNGTPDDNANAEEFANGDTLDGVVDRVFHDQDGNVNTGSQPREQLSAHEVEILLQAHDAGERHGALSRACRK